MMFAICHATSCPESLKFSIISKVYRKIYYGNQKLKCCFHFLFLFFFNFSSSSFYGSCRFQQFFHKFVIVIESTIVKSKRLGMHVLSTSLASRSTWTGAVDITTHTLLYFVFNKFF